MSMLLFLAKWADRSSILMQVASREKAIELATKVAEEEPDALPPFRPLSVTEVRGFIAEVLDDEDEGITFSPLEPFAEVIEALEDAEDIGTADTVPPPCAEESIDPRDESVAKCFLHADHAGKHRAPGGLVWA